MGSFVERVRQSEWLNMGIRQTRQKFATLFGFADKISVTAAISISKSGLYLAAQFLNVGHSQIQHCSLQVFMTQPYLNRADRNPILLPASRARLAESMQIPMLTHRIGFAGHVNIPLSVVLTLGDGRFALAAVETGAQRNRF